MKNIRALFGMSCCLQNHQGLRTCICAHPSNLFMQSWRKSANCKQFAKVRQFRGYETKKRYTWYLFFVWWSIKGSEQGSLRSPLVRAYQSILIIQFDERARKVLTSTMFHEKKEDTMRHPLSFGGPSRARTLDRPVMSRWL